MIRLAIALRGRPLKALKLGNETKLAFRCEQRGSVRGDQSWLGWRGRVE